ncbi:CA14.2 family protein [Megaselia abdita]
MQALTLVVFCFIFYSGRAWEYIDQDNWGQQYPDCDGSRQSPIDINPNIEATKGSTIKFINYGNTIPGKDLPITNNGHTVSISFAGIKESQLPLIKGGILGDDSYILQELHFHWGANKSVGSEHTFNGKSYALEGHLVHRNTKYGSIPEAVNNSDGLTVLGILYQEQTVIPRSPLYQLTNRFSEVRTCEKEDTLSGNINLRRIFPAFDSRTYYNYPGSLTTPACNEAVNWIVYANPSGVAAPEMKEFRALKDCNGDPLVDNFRKTQPLNGRVPRKIMEKIYWRSE